MEFKGIKGPWIITSGDPNGVELDAIRIQSEHGDEWDIAAVWSDIKHDDEICKANAKLISKAPEMLEHLKMVVKLEDLIKYPRNVKQEHIGEAQAIAEMLYLIKQLIKEATEL